MKYDHKEIIRLFFSVAAGYFSGNVINKFPFSLLISAITIVVVYYTADLILNKLR